MEHITNALARLRGINDANALSNEGIGRLEQEMAEAKVCMPVIGKFSSGKSAMLNTLLHYTNNILKEDITPETAVPTEITYSPDGDRVYVVNNDGTSYEISLEEYKALEADANAIRCIRLYLKDSALERIPDVMLVDMPGFESGFDVHNRAIDSYLPQSLAYIVAFPADDMILRDSIRSILKELRLHDMPVCVAITKYDKRGDDFEDTLAALLEGLEHLIGESGIPCCKTSRRTGDAEELEEFLIRIQEQSQEILARKFRNAALCEADATENYLRATKNSSDLSASELEEEEDRLHRQLDSLSSQVSGEKDSFDRQMADCVEEVKGDVMRALEAEETSFVAMAMNNQSINERVNAVVRSAVTASVQKRIVPRMEKYLQRVADCINGDEIGDVYISFQFSPEDASKGMVSKAVSAIAALVIAGPVIGGIIAALIALGGGDKREERKNKIRMQLRSDVYPQVLKEVGSGLSMAVTKQLARINTSIEDEIARQQATLEKAMEDVRLRLSDEKEQKEHLAERINAHLEEIRLIRDDIDTGV